jgi:hypothetical protein
MGERVLSYQLSEKDQIADAHRIRLGALQVIDRAYGSGYPKWTVGRHDLPYHNGHHGRAVGNMAVKLCTAYGLPRVEQAIANVAGFAHDIVQLKGRGIDEDESADWLDKALQEKHSFPAHLREMAILAILGTQPKFRNGRLIGQAADDLFYPTKNAELVAKSVASADFGELHTPQGPYLGHQLFREIHKIAPNSTLPRQAIIGFQQNQIELGESYTYPLVKAEHLLATHRPEVIAHHQDVLEKLEKGTLESWAELIDYDLAFMYNNS